MKNAKHGKFGSVRHLKIVCLEHINSNSNRKL